MFTVILPICEWPACGYRWSSFIRMVNLSFDENEPCPCCPECGGLLGDGDKC